MFSTARTNVAFYTSHYQINVCDNVLWIKLHMANSYADA